MIIIKYMLINPSDIMDASKLSEYKKKYDLFKHHTWAGSILLAILLAIRIFLNTSEIKIDDNIMLFFGIIIVCYMLVSLIFTYRYRTGLSKEEKNIKTNTNGIQKEKFIVELEKDRLKIEKKKVKSEIKKKKKSNN